MQHSRGAVTLVPTFAVMRRGVVDPNLLIPTILLKNSMLPRLFHLEQPVVKVLDSRLYWCSTENLSMSTAAGISVRRKGML